MKCCELFLAMIIIGLFLGLSSCEEKKDPGLRPDDTKKLAGKIWRLQEAHMVEEDQADNLCVTPYNGEETCNSGFQKLRTFELWYNYNEGYDGVATGDEEFYLPWRKDYFTPQPASIQVVEEITFTADGNGLSRVYQVSENKCEQIDFSWEWNNLSIKQINFALHVQKEFSAGYFSDKNFFLLAARSFIGGANFLQMFGMSGQGTSKPTLYPDFYEGDPFEKETHGDIDIEFEGPDVLIMKKHYYGTKKGNDSYYLNDTGDDRVKFAFPTMVKDWVLELKFTEVEEPICDQPSECEALTCRNGGEFLPEECACHCPEGYTGPLCEEKIPGTTCEEEVECENGTLEQADGECYCDCLTGWEGDACDERWPTVSTYYYSAQLGLSDGIMDAYFNGSGDLYVTALESNSINFYNPESNNALQYIANGKGYTNGSTDIAQFDGPAGITEYAGKIYIADSGNHVIRVYDPATDMVSTLAGSGTAGFADGTGDMAQFNSPLDVAPDGNGYLYVADTYNNGIRKIDLATSEVTTVAGSATGFMNGSLASSRFDKPTGIAFVNSDTIYIADCDNASIRIISLVNNTVQTYVGEKPDGSEVGIISTSLNHPTDIAIDPVSKQVFISDTKNNWIRVVRKKPSSADGVEVSENWVGQPDKQPGFLDGTRTAVRFTYPKGLAFDEDGYLYVADYGNHAVRRIDFR